MILKGELTRVDPVVSNKTKEVFMYKLSVLDSDVKETVRVECFTGSWETATAPSVGMQVELLILFETGEYAGLKVDCVIKAVAPK